MLHVKRISFLSFALAALVSSSLADDWPQWRGPQRDGVWRETGIVEKFASDQLTPEWRVEIGSGYCGPTISKGRLYLMLSWKRPSWRRESELCLTKKFAAKWSDCPSQCKRRPANKNDRPLNCYAITSPHAWAKSSSTHVTCRSRYCS